MSELFDGDGFIIKRNYYPEKHIKEINFFLDGRVAKVNGLNYNVPWGYGDFKKDSFFLNKILTENLKQEVSQLYPEGWGVSHMVVNEKSPLVGQDVEWHQECSNIDTFSPGAEWKADWKKFIQVYVALDDETDMNGGLLIFTKSHQDGLLEHKDIISPSLTHKRGLTYDSLKFAASKFLLKKINLRAGDLLMFNSLLIHGSGRNMDTNRRRSVVLQLFSNNVPTWNQVIFDNEHNYRKNFVSSTLKSYLKQFEERVIYQDLKR